MDLLLGRSVVSPKVRLQGMDDSTKALANDQSYSPVAALERRIQVRTDKTRDRKPFLRCESNTRRLPQINPISILCQRCEASMIRRLYQKTLSAEQPREYALAGQYAKQGRFARAT